MRALLGRKKLCLFNDGGASESDRALSSPSCWSRDRRETPSHKGNIAKTVSPDRRYPFPVPTAKLAFAVDDSIGINVTV